MQRSKYSSSIIARRVPQNDDGLSLILRNFSKSHSHKFAFSRFLKIFFVILHFTFFILHSSIMHAIEVSGHISENTTWSADNNPYIVVDNIWVDQNATLTILPGTIVKFYDSQYPFGGDFNYSDGYSEAKFIKVSGRIIATGTAQDSILFTKISDDPNRRWANIILDYLSADDSRFEYCKIEYTYKMRFYVAGDFYFGAITLNSARAIINNCFFKNYYSGIHAYYDSSPWIYQNYFTCNDENAPNFTLSAILFEDNIGTKPYIAYNTFENIRAISLTDVNISSFLPITYNTFLNCSPFMIYSESPSFIYKNEFYDGTTAIVTYDYESIIKNNLFNCLGGINADWTCEISENIFENGVGAIALNSDDNGESFIFNNIIRNESYSGIHLSYCNATVANNLILNCDDYGIETTGAYEAHFKILNNTISGSDIGLELASNCDVSNNILYDIEDFSIKTHGTSSVINSSNNCFSAPNQIGMNITYNDLGGNIEEDPLFLDPFNDDFHFLSNSPCIDTGLDDVTPFDLPVYDLDFNERIWDGDNNGNPIIDMGCYEFGFQPAIGGIEGIISQDYISNFLPFTEVNINGALAFPDTAGYYEVKLLPGTYELTANLEFYEEVSIPNIIVVAGEYTQVNFEMNSLVEVEENEIPANSSLISHLSNYPNPFNPITTISFDVTQTSPFATIEIYNLKGQKVRTIPINSSTHQPINSVTWNGTDQTGKSVSSGIYFARLKSGKIEASCKMLLLK